MRLMEVVGLMAAKMDDISVFGAVPLGAFSSGRIRDYEVLP
jgi:hypothetical protein